MCVRLREDIKYKTEPATGRATIKISQAHLKSGGLSPNKRHSAAATESVYARASAAAAGSSECI